MIIGMRIRMEGFIVFDYEKQFPEARKELAQWLSEGKLKRKEHIVKGGLAKAEQALSDLFNGANTGKHPYIRVTFYNANHDRQTPRRSRKAR
jgi:NADPH-dependent curcumin reductase CurA